MMMFKSFTLIALVAFYCCEAHQNRDDSNSSSLQDLKVVSMTHFDVGKEEPIAAHRIHHHTSRGLKSSKTKSTKKSKKSKSPKVSTTSAPTTPSPTPSPTESPTAGPSTPPTQAFLP